MLSTADDMSKWLKFNLNNYGEGTSENKQLYSSILSPDAHEELHTAQNIIPESNSDKLYRKPTCPVSYMTPNYGLGWRIGTYRGRLHVVIITLRPINKRLNQLQIDFF